MLSYQQGILQFHPPLTLAETASIFGEMIVFRDLLAKAPSDEDRLAMLMSKIDDIINSVVRQCSFDAFEAKVHSARAAGTLTPDEMTKARGVIESKHSTDVEPPPPPLRIRMSIHPEVTR